MSANRNVRMSAPDSGVAGASPDLVSSAMIWEVYDSNARTGTSRFQEQAYDRGVSRRRGCVYPFRCCRSRPRCRRRHGSWDRLREHPRLSWGDHACYQNVTSANKPVKLLDTAKATTCPSGWKPVSWNQQDPPGPAGSSVVMRGRASNVDVPPGAGANGVTPYKDVGLSPSSWLQGASEINLLAGSVTATAPATCHWNGSTTTP